MQRAILQRLRGLIEAERKRKGRLPHRPRGSGGTSSDLGKRVEALKAARNLNDTEAQEAVAKETGLSLKTVRQAHLRWLNRLARKPVVLRRK